MPIYMDRHDLNDSITAEHVAKIHQEDLKVEHEFGCQGLTYWFDDHRKTAFCLIKAPNKEALKEMHNKAHGAIPNSIVEVDPHIVESFLGRIEDPEKAIGSKLNIIEDPAFRILMMVEIRPKTLLKDNREMYDKELERFHGCLKIGIQESNGSLVRDRILSSLISFKSSHNALEAATFLQTEFTSSKLLTEYFQITIGMSSGVPVSNGNEIFEETIATTENLCKVVTSDIVASSEIRDLYRSENASLSLIPNKVRFLSPSEEIFLQKLMVFMSTSWNKANIKINDFSVSMGISKSQLYRNIISITGVSLNIFLKQYRLQQALTSIKCKKGNISEIAFDCGFNSPAYFSKCFYESYGILPSAYAKSI